LYGKWRQAKQEPGHTILNKMAGEGMNVWLQTIRSRDGKQILHGSVVWKNGEEFGFVPQGCRIHGAWWCKSDYWELLEGHLPVYGMKVIRE
jgi:hypothetical protein